MVDISVNVEMPIVPAPEVELGLEFVEKVSKAIGVGALPAGIGIERF